ncbi:hypothetical protein LTR28_002527 [Elasticomyces elasticus]|nr:hypothetical protein LTR28_002527 [Elasticomyces elasticus]
MRDAKAGSSEYITLVSNDGFEFKIQRSSACISGMIKRMLDPNVSRHSGIVLEKVCEYFYYNEKYKDSRDVPDMDFPPELCLELLMAADFLDT